MGTTTSTISRLKVVHPDLGYDGGADLHTYVRNIYNQFGDNINSRVFFISTFPSGDTVTLAHNLGTRMSHNRFMLYTGSYAIMTPLTGATTPSLNNFSFVDTFTFENSRVDITNNSGAQVSLIVVLYQESVSPNPITLKQQTSADKSPTGYNTIYPKTDDKLYYKNSSNVEKQIGDVTLAGAEVLTNKDIDGGTASNTSRISIPKNTTSNLAGLTRKEATLVYDSTSKKLNVDDGSSLKVVGGGLIPSPITKDSSSTLENGKHYLYDGSSMAADKTLNLPAITAEANIKITVYNIPVGYKVIIAPNGAEKIFFNDTDQSTVEFIATETEQWAEFISNNTKWIVNDAVGGIGYTLSGPLTVTGDFTPSGGIVGKTNGVAVAAGYVGERSGTVYSGTTGGSSASTQSVTSAGSGSYVKTGAVALNKGTYWVSVTMSGVSSVTSNLYVYLGVGGIGQVTMAHYISCSAGGTACMTISAPIDITIDGTELQCYAKFTAGSVSGCQTEIFTSRRS